MSFKPNLSWTDEMKAEKLIEFTNKLIVPEHEKCGCGVQRKEYGTECPFSAEIRGTVNVCDCCNSCRGNCADDI